MHALIRFKRSCLRKQNLAKNGKAFTNVFPHKDENVSRSPGTGIPLHFVKRNFEELVLEQRISEKDRVQMMQKCLSSVGQEYFCSPIRRTVANSEIAFNMISDRLSSKKHQSQALSYLCQLSFSGIMNEMSCSDIEAQSTEN